LGEAISEGGGGTASPPAAPPPEAVTEEEHEEKEAGWGASPPAPEALDDLAAAKSTMTLNSIPEGGREGEDGGTVPGEAREEKEKAVEEEGAPESVIELAALSVALESKRSELLVAVLDRMRHKKAEAEGESLRQQQQEGEPLPASVIHPMVSLGEPLTASAAGALAGTPRASPLPPAPETPAPAPPTGLPTGLPTGPSLLEQQDERDEGELRALHQKYTK